MAIKFVKGQHINNLTIMEDKHSYSKADAGGNIRRYWKCQCDCGNITYVSATALKRGSTKSCGCLIKEKIVETSRKDETGNRYGKLLVIDYAYTRENRAYWNCLCDCGRTVQIQGPHLRTGNTKSCGQCSSRSLGENKICEILTKLNLSFSQQVRFSTCKDVQQLPFDFALYEHNKVTALIEFQGPQHYQATGGWSTQEHFITLQRHDKIKKEWAEKNNIPLYIIPYTEFDNLEEIIKNISKNN